VTLAFIRIEDAGDLPRERVILRAQADVDVGMYALLQGAAIKEDSKPDNTAVYAGAQANAFWFPRKEIKKSDWVVVYTKAGDRSEKAAENGPTSHFYYWRKGRVIWSPGTAVIVLYAPSWEIGPPVP
jgi:hypothetical protein